MEGGRRPNKRIPRELTAVLRNLLQVEMRARFASGGEVLEAMASAVPDESPLIEQAPIPPKELASAFRENARKLMRDARAHIEGSRPMEAAATLRQLAATLPAGEGDLRSQAAELVEEALWYTFRVSSIRRSGERERMEALSLTLGRAAAQLRAKELAGISRRRLGVYARRDGPLKDELLPLLDQAQRQARIQELKKGLDGHPGAGLPALELAVLTPGFHGTDASSLIELRVDLLEKHELFTAALYHRTQTLATAGASPRLLDGLRVLLEGALKKAGLLQASAPPPMGLTSSPGTMPGTTSPGTSPGTVPGLRSSPGSAPSQDPLAGLNRAALLSSFVDGQASTHKRRPTQIVLVPGEPVSAEERAMIMEDARSMVKEGEASAAIDIYHQLLENGLLYPENPDAVVWNNLRSLTWMSVVPSEERRPPISVQAKLYAVVHAMNPPGLVEICERIFLERLPEESRGKWIEEVLARNPWSVAANLIAMREARRLGNRQEEARFRVTVGQELIQLGAVAPAQEYLRQAKELAPHLAAADAALVQADQELAKHQRANAEFAQIREEVEGGAPTTQLEASLNQFLSWHPNYLPALNVAADLAETQGDRERAADLHFRLANVALLIEQDELARSHLRRALRADPHADDPLLLLSLLTDPVEEPCNTADELRVALMVREGLVDVANERLRAQLKGSLEDVMTFERLAKLAQQADQDPGPYWVEQGSVALHLGHTNVARECLEHALRYSGDRLGALESIQQIAGIEVSFPPEHLKQLDELLRD
jgi:tetratricopeptide (TPR) repeat protein